jgi:succinoglycan biosynthesis protein ExoH
MWMIWNRIAGDGLYPLFYVVAIVISFIALVATNALVSTRISGLYEVLTGSRGRKAKSILGGKSYPPPGSVQPSKPVLTQQQR